MAAELGVDPGSIDVRKPFSRYGMDSMTAVVLTGELEQWLGRPVPPDLLGQFASIESLAEHLAQEAPPTETSAIQPPAEEPEGRSLRRGNVVHHRSFSASSRG